jgi:hypothetical protein
MLKKLITLAIIILLFAIVADVKSQEPSPGPTIRSNPPQIQTSDKQQPPEADKRGTEQSPFVVKTINPQKNQAEIYQEKKEHNEKTAIDRSLVRYTGILAIFTAILAFFTIVLAGVAVWQGIQMREAVKVASDTAIRQLRAYILVDRIGINKIIANFKPEAIVEFRNSGQTPAYEVHGSICIGFDEFPLEDIPWDKLHPTMDRSKDTMAPGGKLHFPVILDNSLTTKEFSQLNAGTHAIYIFGKFIYKDTFGKDRFTEFTFFCHKSAPHGFNSPAVYSKGNEAN